MAALRRRGLDLALYGDYWREKVFPIDLKIEPAEESNTVFDKCEINGTSLDVYRHHLRVVNKTHHKAIKKCRVWLKQISAQNVAGEWKEEITFAVPRLMEWAPSEYSRDQRTFCTQQVFDFGTTLPNNGGFEVTIWREQGGTFKFNRRFPVGKKLRFVFFVTADNYQKEKTFKIQVEVPQSVQGETVTPAKVYSV